MKKLLTSILVTISTVLFSQNSDKTIGDSLRSIGKLDEAIDFYATQYSIDPENRSNTYNYSCALALNKQIDSSFKYLFIATKDDSITTPLNDPDFYFLLKDERWLEFENFLIPNIEAKYTKYSNLSLTKELWRMKIKDQAFYYHIKISDKTNGAKSPITKALWELKKLINAENLIRLEQIISEIGWPKKSEVGSSASGTVFLIIQHADLETQKKYLPLMTEAANNKEASWGSLALLIDRINIREGKKQIYGSQIGRNEDGSYFVKDIENPEYVNQRRDEVGLGPLEDYAKYLNIDWTVKQKEK